MSFSEDYNEKGLSRALGHWLGDVSGLGVDPNKPETYAGPSTPAFDQNGVGQGYGLADQIIGGAEVGALGGTALLPFLGTTLGAIGGAAYGAGTGLGLWGGHEAKRETSSHHHLVGQA